jgi:hypothetical protein
MPQLTIPEDYVAGLAQIVALPDAVINELTSALAESPASLDIKAATSSISGKVLTIPQKDIRRILATLLSLYSLRAFRETETDDFIDDIVRAMKRSKRPELALADSDNRFRDRLKRLLGFSAFATASKAVFLQHEHEHTLCTARIFTDARPVYGDDATSLPSVVAITHMLKLAYHEGNRLEEIHVALDKADLMKLKLLIERAESKGASFRKVFDSANIQVIE